MRYFTIQFLRLLAMGLCLLAFGGLLSPLNAQPSANTGTVNGTVLDQTGKPIPSAVEEIKNESTGVSRSVKNDADGKFSVPDLASGSYSIRVSAPGFALT